jgi:dihydroneopterin aldolase
MTEIEVRGLRVFGRHGVEEEEREQGQVFLFDLWLRPLRAPVADRIADTVDYRGVAACVAEVCERRSLRLIESLAAAVADELLARFPLERVRVRVRKPQVRLQPPAEYTAATVERP